MQDTKNVQTPPETATLTSKFVWPDREAEERAAREDIERWLAGGEIRPKNK